MGNIIAGLLKFAQGQGRETRILLLGLDAAGKTTILYKMKLGENIHTFPTIGFNVESVKYKNLNFTCWDIGGQDKIRPLWRHYYPGTDAIIFVVDSNDRDRMGEVHEEMVKMLQDPEMPDQMQVLVFANKQDLPHAMKPVDIADKLHMSQLRCQNWYVQPCDAISGDGLYEGLHWLSTVLKSKK